ncbi:DNA mismatch repair protein MutS [Fennellomyces sp. T-0311]|nr:DNA mismatch repair protein MutS [Fennellomyces sp. T-0311]
MFRFLPRPRSILRTSHFSRRSIFVSLPIAKRVTRGTLDNVFEPEITTPRTPVKKKTRKRRTAETESQDLEAKSESTGSVVLDTVRKYTKKHPECVLLVQVGDFYELYESHATEYALQLDLKLTRKEMTSGMSVDFAGFPSRALDRYLDILVNRLACRVALCEQYTVAKRDGDESIVGIHRHITRVITPGTVIEERFLDSQSYNYLMAVMPTATDELGLAWIDISVGEFMVQPSTLDVLKDDVARIRPREIILPSTLKSVIEEDTSHPITRILSNHNSISVSFLPDNMFDVASGRTILRDMFGYTDITFTDYEIGASKALLDYINDTHPCEKPQLLKPVRMSIKDTLQIDSATVASLELVQCLRDGGKANSLLGVINHTMTNAGSRQLAQWMLAPSSSIETIRWRHDIVEFFTRDSFVLEDIRTILRQSADAQRALQRLALRRGQHSDMLEISSTLNAIRAAKELLNDVFLRSSTVSSSVKDLVESLDPHPSLAEYITSVVDQERIMSNEAKDYGLIRADFDPQLRDLHEELDILHRCREKLQDNLRAIGGNSVSLLVNALYKHMVEINASQASKLRAQHPEATLIHQTKVKHRYQLPEWTDLSIRIQSTHGQILELENQIWEKAVDRVLAHSASIIAASAILAQLDVLCSFAWIARRFKYARPIMRANTNNMHIVDGRHPVVEANLAQKGRPFIKNDCVLGDHSRTWLLTGPNMGGKSTFLRQNAIIILLAHMGSFVPASYAEIGIADRIMSRIGTADDLAQDLSTFMVEMMETANILAHATPQSLVIMDEVGRGTATADGISLAYAILDYLHTHSKSRILFATHYRELCDLVNQNQELSTIQLYKTDLAEDSKGRFVFLHKIQPGVCHQSHGLKVAQLAGLPREVISTARAMWSTLNSTRSSSISANIQPKECFGNKPYL